VIATSTGEVVVYKLNCTVLRNYFERVQSMWLHLTDVINIDITTEYSTCGKTSAKYAIFYIVQARRTKGLVHAMDHARKIGARHVGTRLILPRVYTTLA